MSAPRHPTAQYTAGDFVVSSGSVLFQHQQNSNDDKLRICVLHHLRRDEWLLPKGRKDQRETIEQAAVRETYEETGYPCELWPQTVPTRAPRPGVSDVHDVELATDCIEPIAVTIRQLTETRIKIIYWFITRVMEGREKEENTQMANESFESVFLDVEDALQKLTFEVDREVVRKAVDIVRGDVVLL